MSKWFRWCTSIHFSMCDPGFVVSIIIISPPILGTSTAQGLSEHVEQKCPKFDASKIFKVSCTWFSFLKWPCRGSQGYFGMASIDIFGPGLTTGGHCLQPNGPNGSVGHRANRAETPNSQLGEFPDAAGCIFQPDIINQFFFPLGVFYLWGFS